MAFNHGQESNENFIASPIQAAFPPFLPQELAFHAI